MSIWFKAAFHDTDILARILADTSDTRDFLKLFLHGKQSGEVARHADILARIPVSVSWNAAFMVRFPTLRV